MCTLFLHPAFFVFHSLHFQHCCQWVSSALLNDISWFWELNPFSTILRRYLNTIIDQLQSSQFSETHKHTVDRLKAIKVFSVFSYFRILSKQAHTQSNTHTPTETQQHSHSVVWSHRDSVLLEGTPLFIPLSSAMYQAKWVSLCVYFLSLSGVMFGGLCCLWDMMCFCIKACM